MYCAYYKSSYVWEIFDMYCKVFFEKNGEKEIGSKIQKQIIQMDLQRYKQIQCTSQEQK